MTIRRTARPCRGACRRVSRRGRIPQGVRPRRLFCFCMAAATARSEPMDQSQGTVGQKIARAARAFEQQRTKHGRNWVAVFMNEDTIVIALHGSLTAAEKALAQSPAGAAQVREFHRQLFTNASATLLRKIKSITGMEVRTRPRKSSQRPAAWCRSSRPTRWGRSSCSLPADLPGHGLPGHGAPCRHDR